MEIGERIDLRRLFRAPGQLGMRDVRSTFALGLLLGSLYTPLSYAEAPDELAPGRFLVASRDLGDPNFRETVVLLVEYERREGALGLIVNRPTEVDLARVLLGEEDIVLGPVFQGGPVAPLQMSVLVRTPAELSNARPVFDDVQFSSSRELLLALSGAEPSEIPFRAYAGYAGWAPGQLELEVDAGGWHVMDGDGASIFGDTSDLWTRWILRGTADWACRPAPVDRTSS